MRIRINLGSVSPQCMLLPRFMKPEGKIYALTEMYETKGKYMIYDKLNFILDLCPPRDTLIALDNFSTTTDTGIANYELCVDSHGSSHPEHNQFYFPEFGRSNRLRNSGSLCYTPELPQGYLRLIAAS